MESQQVTAEPQYRALWAFAHVKGQHDVVFEPLCPLCKELTAALWTYVPRRET